MDWVQFVVFCLGVGGLWFWQRTETRSDMRHMDLKLDANRELIHEVHKETNGLMKSFQKETTDMMKDFHYRLLEIERNRK